MIATAPRRTSSLFPIFHCFHCSDVDGWMEYYDYRCRRWGGAEHVYSNREAYSLMWIRSWRVINQKSIFSQPHFRHSLSVCLTKCVRPDYIYSLLADSSVYIVRPRGSSSSTISGIASPLVRTIKTDVDHTIYPYNLHVLVRNKL